MNKVICRDTVRKLKLYNFACKDGQGNKEERNS